MKLKNSKIKNIFLLFYSTLISNFVFEIFQNAISFHVFNITNSSFKFAMIYVIESLPKFIYLRISDLLKNKFGKKEMFNFPEFLKAYFLLFVFIYSYFKKIELYFCFITVFIFGVLRAFAAPINKSIIPSVIEKEYLLKANFFDFSFDKISRTLAPLISLLIFAKLGFDFSFLVCALIYFGIVILKNFIGLGKNDKFLIIKKIHMKDGKKILFKEKALMLLSFNAIITQFIFYPFFLNFIPNILKNLSSDNKEISYYYLRKLIEFLGNQQYDKYMTLYALINLGGFIGVLISLSLINHFKIGEKKKNLMDISLIIISFSSFIILFSSLFFVILKKDVTYLAIILFFSNIIMFIGLNIYTFLFSIFYQKILSKQLLEKFIPNIMIYFLIFKMLGHTLYGILLNKSLYLSLYLFGFGIFIKIILHIYFKKTLKEEINADIRN